VVRLQKYLASCGIASRRRSEELIAGGRVKVNGRPATLGDEIEPSIDLVTVDGRRVEQEDRVYIVFNKPKGIVTTAKDTHNRKTVIDAVAQVRARVYPVGRLDMDVQGALLLTNDGELAYRLTHPKHEVAKVYLAWVQGRMTAETAARLEQGVALDDGVTAPAGVALLNTGRDSTLVRLTLHEGRKREVKRMCAAVGHPVRELRRIAFGGIHVKGLKPGEWRYLQGNEISSLRRLTGL